MQNTSHAVMAQRTEPKDSRDDFPTLPWATRALCEYVLPPHLDELSCLEPACGRGYMAQTLMEYFKRVRCYDAYDYGWNRINNYLTTKNSHAHDWIITNPPFRLAEQFILKALKEANAGVAMLTRTTFLESVGRYERLFKPHPPTVVAQFVERVPMVKGRLDKNASTATAYAWLVWQHCGPYQVPLPPEMFWIPPCRKKLERKGDYR